MIGIVLFKHCDADELDFKTIVFFLFIHSIFTNIFFYFFTVDFVNVN